MYKFRENESDKIANELMNKLYPMDVLNEYFMLGYARSLIDIVETIERYVEATGNIELNSSEVIEAIADASKGNKTLHDFYDRLSKEKADIRKAKDSLNEIK